MRALAGGSILVSLGVYFIDNYTSHSRGHNETACGANDLPSDPG
jgi:hypothetical protein